MYLAHNRPPVIGGRLCARFGLLRIDSGLVIKNNKASATLTGFTKLRE